MPPRRGRRLEDMTPEQRAAVETIRARNRTPGRRAEDERFRRLVREAFPPAAADPGIATAPAPPS